MAAEVSASFLELACTQPFTQLISVDYKSTFIKRFNDVLIPLFFLNFALLTSSYKITIIMLLFTQYLQRSTPPQFLYDVSVNLIRNNTFVHLHERQIKFLFSFVFLKGRQRRTGVSPFDQTQHFCHNFGVGSGEGNLYFDEIVKKLVCRIGNPYPYILCRDM